MFAGSVHCSPNSSTVAWWTGRNDVVRSLLDEPRLLGGQLDLQGKVVDRGHHDLVTERCAVRLTAVVFGGALDPAELVRVAGRPAPDRERRFHAYSKSAAVTGSPFVHVPSWRRWKVTSGPSTSHDSARAGTASSVSGLSLTSGSIRAPTTFADVVSSAIPGSSAGGSAPHAIVMTCSAAGCPPSVAAPGVVACCAVIVVVATATGGSERENCHERGNEQEPCLSSHFRPPLSFQSNGRTEVSPHGHCALRRALAPEVSARGGRGARRSGCRRASLCSRRP